MPPPPPPSQIRALVQWREPSVYAGEEIECVITFKNVALPLPQPGSIEEGRAAQVNGQLSSGRASLAGLAASTAPSRRSSTAQTKGAVPRMPSASSTRDALPARRQAPTLSLNVVNASMRAGLRSAPVASKTPDTPFRPSKGHGRSLSIMSISSDAPNDGQAPSVSAPVGKRPVQGHGRSASLQVMSRPTLQQASPAIVSTDSPQQLSPLNEPLTPPPLQETAFSNGFSFPAKPPARDSPLLKSPSASPPKPSRGPATIRSALPLSPTTRPSEGVSGTLINFNPVSRVMSESSTGDTPRTSSEFYIMSNHSDETVTSELPSQYLQNGRFLHKPLYSQQAAQSKPSLKLAQTEALMMGYVQTVGNFVLDGSLINTAPFEEVKRKGVQSGGGVVGIDQSKRASGMFGALSWGNLGESLGGLLGADDMSSIAQMKASAKSKSVPLLSTPQSVLFVNLVLAPGESRSYSYRFTLPRGLPPSHRGRAIKVNYYLAIGVQRPETQMARTVEVPFRVLGSYNTRGETLGHDLMSPYVLLEDRARIANIALSPSFSTNMPTFAPKEAQKHKKTPKQGLEDFLRYTERLLEKPDDAHDALPSPTFPEGKASLSRKQSFVDQPPADVKDAIDCAILRSNHVASAGKQSDGKSTNRFNIARSGQPVAVLTLLRPAFRLGEAVIGTIDFTNPANEGPDGLPAAPVYAIHAELESAEHVDPSLALRSGSSIQRATRKVYGSMHENAMFARRLSFSLNIPTTATPTFETTGVSLVWRLKIEFTTRRQVQGLGIEDGGNADGLEEMREELGSDDHGTTFNAKQRLYADTFEIAIPLKVYGVPGIEGMEGGDEALEV